MKTMYYNIIVELNHLFVLFLSSINSTLDIEIKNLKTQNNKEVDETQKKSVLIVILIDWFWEETKLNF